MNQPPLDLKARLEWACLTARRAGAILMEGFGQPHPYRTKGELTDLVTTFDLRSQATILDSLRTAFPTDGVVAEEEGGRAPGEVFWLIDPLDGTTNFVHSVPVFCVSMAFRTPDGTQLGVIFDPLRQELFHAQRGQGAWLNGQFIQVSKTETLDHSLLATGFPYDIRTTQDNNLGHYATLALRTQGVRRLGSAALDLAYVASARFDGYWELQTNAWDVAAGALMVELAGGIVTQVDGQPGLAPASTSVLATNGRLHPALLEALRD